MTDLSIVIVSYNTKKLLNSCLFSVFQNTVGLDYEIIVVDNASSDGSVKLLLRLAKKGTNLKPICNRANVGFGKANNQGIKKAIGKYILFLNSDTLIKDNILGEMVRWMEEHPEVGAATCALKNKDGSLQGTGGYFPNLLRVLTWMFFIDDIPYLDLLIKPFHPMHSSSPFYKNVGHFKKTKEVDWITGAFILARAEALNKIGGFDEGYFMYTEDVDLCYRIKKLGWKIWYLPNWSIIHLGGSSSNKEYPLIKEYEGIKIFYRKHKQNWQYPILRILLKVGALGRVVLFGVMKGKEAAIIYAKAYKVA